MNYVPAMYVTHVDVVVRWVLHCSMYNTEAVTAARYAGRYAILCSPLHRRQHPGDARFRL